jgi:hypothetical protein
MGECPELPFKRGTFGV